jgi:rare lipoprotein A (peptidoglycan hydrolase)
MFWITAIITALCFGIIIGARVRGGVDEHEAKVMQAKLDEAILKLADANLEIEQNRVLAHVWTGIASWYGDREQGRLTASGQIFDMNGLTAASRTIRLGSMIIVENAETGRMVPVLINDRGPYITGRGLDVSKAVAERLGILKKGLAKVRVYELVQGRPSIED